MPLLHRVQTPILARLAADPELFRILPLHTFLPPNSATTLGLDHVRGYDALAPASWREQRELLGRFSAAPTVSDVLEPQDLAPGGAALDAWNVKYLLLHPQLPYSPKRFGRELGLDLETVYAGPDGVLLRNRRVLPRVRLAGPGVVGAVSASVTRWQMEVVAEGDSLVIVANPFFPGWQALVDRERVRIEAGVGEMIRIPVEAGSHRVELRYRPLSFLIGLGCAALALVATVGVLARRSG